MKVAVLGSLRSWYLADLSRAAAGRHEIVPATFRELAAWVGGESRQRSGTLDLQACDAVLVRTMPPGSLEQVVFRMDVLGRLEAAGMAVLNPPRAVEAAVDKYLALARMEAAGLAVPRTVVCQSAATALEAFAAFGGDVVLKPLFGSEGRGVARLTDDAIAERTFRLYERLGAVLYVQQYIPHPQGDWRLLVIGQRVLGMRRHNPDDWRSNASRGARCEPLEVTPELAALACRAAEAVGAPLAGVDVLPAPDGTCYAIEVNAVPGWQALARTLKVDVARWVLELLELRRATGSWS